MFQQYILQQQLESWLHQLLIYSSFCHLHVEIFNKAELSDHRFSVVEAYAKVQKAQENCCGHEWASGYQKGHLRQKEKEYFNHSGSSKLHTDT